MIPARHTFTGKLVSDYFSGYRLGRAFRPVGMHCEGTDCGHPLLLLSNHFSWWDGFIQYRLNREFFGRKLYVMMLEEQLRRNMILNRCGAFSIRRNSRDSVESIRYCCDLLADPGHTVLVFPQGEIQSVHTERIRFRKGVDAILKRTPGPVQVVMNVNLPDYFSRPRPSLSVYARILRPGFRPGGGELEEEFNRYYSECKLRQKG